jgi:hypothetical protein
MEMSTLGVAAAGTVGAVAIAAIVATWKQCCGQADGDDKGKTKGGDGSGRKSGKQPEMSLKQARKILAQRAYSVDAGKRLEAACKDLREAKRRVAEDQDLGERVKFAADLAPAIKEMKAKYAALDAITDRHERLREYLTRKVFFKYEIPELLKEAKLALRQYDDGLAKLEAEVAKLKKSAADAEDPPSPKQSIGIYRSDTQADAATVEFDKLATDLDEGFDKLLKRANEEVARFRSPDFEAMRQALHQAVHMDKRMQDEHKGPVKKKAVSGDADVDDDAKPLALPAAPRDATTGLRFRVMNGGRAPDDQLTNAEQSKADSFVRLDGTVLTGRLRDLMNAHFGCFERVNHETIRLSKRRRLEFDVVTTATEVQATIVHIGDPTYAH